MRAGEFLSFLERRADLGFGGFDTLIMHCTLLRVLTYFLDKYDI